MKLQEKQSLFCAQVPKLIEYIISQGFTCTFGETYRTEEQADWYFKQGMGIKDSLHCKRLAIDLNVFDHNGVLLREVKDYELFGIYWESLHEHFRWGGRFTDKKGNPKPDADHFELQDI